MIQDIKNIIYDYVLGDKTFWKKKEINMIKNFCSCIYIFNSEDVNLPPGYNYKDVHVVIDLRGIDNNDNNAYCCKYKIYKIYAKTLKNMPSLILTDEEFWEVDYNLDRKFIQYNE